MFGGFGLYKNGVIVGIIVDNEFYFKVDNKTRRYFEKYGSRPFTYERQKKVITLGSYFLVTEEMMTENEIKSWLTGKTA